MKGIQRTRRLAWRTVEGQVFIIDSKSSTLHELDEVGSFIWKHLDTCSDPDQLADAVSEGFEVSPSRARTDLDAFLDQLLEKGLIERTSP